MTLRTRDFEYDLPGELIAQAPTKRRDQSRLMRLVRATGQISHHRFADLADLLRSGDLMVLNDTRVIPARFTCRRRTGGRIEGLFLREAHSRWQVLLKGASRCRPGETLELLGAPGVQAELVEHLGEGRWLLEVSAPTGSASAGAGPVSAAEVLERCGTTPLPPYIRRPVAGQSDAQAAAATQAAADRERYQTVYAARPGAVAAPTAGLHFTGALLDALHHRGVESACVTLHVGLGTFTPVQADEVSAHRMHAEWYDLPAAAADRLNAARRDGRRIVAVGTTSVRVLESAAARGGPFEAASGWTDIFLYPPAEFRAVDALITNFHLPRSTLVMLVAAFCSPGRTDGRQTILAAYAEAVRLRYRFYSYGDAMLIE